jgi:wyosine [tRNA(Phe)-imidazoG37] synthetase (radical SAM superfamily)
MPRHPEVVEFSKRIAEHSKYRIIDEHEPSRVTLMMKKDLPERIMKF